MMGTCRRLLLITERFEPDLGGVARSATRIAHALAQSGVSVEVLAWTRALPAGERETREIQLSGAANATVIVHRLGLFANLDYSLQHTITLLESLHRSNPFDGIWGHYLSPAGFLAVYFGRSVGIPATVSARGNDVDMQTFPPGDFARLTWTLERAHSITAVSEDLAKKIRILTTNDKPVRVIANSVDLDIFQPGIADDALKLSLGILPEETVLGFSGELRHKKGLHPLIAAFQQVRQVRPACLLVIGEVRVRDQAALIPLGAEDPMTRSRMIITGHLESQRDVARHLQLCDLFLQPSFWDGLPNAVLEAMACEQLILASDAGGIPEAIEHGKSGFLIPRAKLAEFGEAILELLTLSVSQRQTIGQAARSRVAEHFSKEREAESLKCALEDLWARTNV